jgi:galactokinase
MNSIVEDSKLINRALKRFEYLHGSSEGVSVTVSPASLILLGDHTHYNEGVSISSSINRYWCTAIRLRKDQLISFASADSEKFIFTELSKLGEFQCEEFKLLRGLTKILVDENIVKDGFDCVISTNVPECFGLGSYAGMQISFMNNLNKLFSYSLKDSEILDIIKKNELKILGKISNSAHHYTVQHCKKDKLFYLDLRTKYYSSIPLGKGDYDLIVCDTGERIFKAQEMCNERIEECEVGVKGLRLYIWGIKNLRDVENDFLTRHVHMLPHRIFNRVLHNVNERKRAQSSLNHLRKNSVEDFGVSVTESHWSLSRDYEIGNAEADFIVTEAVKLPGVLCSKMISCTPIKSTINIVDSKLADNFVSKIKELYKKKFHKELFIHYLKITGSVRKVPMNEIILSAN